MNGSVAHHLQRVIRASEIEHGWSPITIRLNDDDPGVDPTFEVVVVSNKTGEVQVVRTLDEWEMVRRRGSTNG